MKRLAMLVLAAAAIGAAAAESQPALPPAADPAQTPERRTVEHDGQVFELASTSTTRNVETDEYVVAGETLATWTQLVTVQRLTLAVPAATDEFLAYFQKRVTGDGASLQVLKRTTGATVFVVRFPASERDEEQVMICLGFLDRTNASRLNIVQYAVKPHRAPVAEVEARIRSWRDKLLRQARAMDASAATAG